MQKLVLYIGSERLDLFKDETVSLTQTIQNVKDIKKIFTEFTQTFSVPASKKITRYLNTTTIFILIMGLMQEENKMLL